MEIDPKFREQIERLLERHDLSKYSRFVAECLDHRPDYVIKEDVVQEHSGPRVERVYAYPA